MRARSSAARTWEGRVRNERALRRCVTGVIRRCHGFRSVFDQSSWLGGALQPLELPEARVELRIAGGAVLAEVEAGGLRLRLRADPPAGLHRPEHAVGGAEREGADDEEPERLDAELMGAARVEEPALPDGEVGRESRDGEEARGEGSPDT